MFALAPKADTHRRKWHVRFVPEADAEQLMRGGPRDAVWIVNRLHGHERVVAAVNV